MVGRHQALRLLRRSAVSGLPATALGLVVLLGLVAAQTAAPQPPTPSQQRLSPADGQDDVRPAPAARIRSQAPARTAPRPDRAVEPEEASSSRSRPPGATTQAGPREVAVEPKAEPADPGGPGERDPVTGLEDCVEEILATPETVGC